MATKGAGKHAVSVKRCIAQVCHQSILLCVVSARHMRVLLSERFVCEIVFRVRVAYLCDVDIVYDSRVLWRGGCTLTLVVCGQPHKRVRTMSTRA